MKTARYSDAQIMGILKQAEGGVPVGISTTVLIGVSLDTLSVLAAPLLLVFTGASPIAEQGLNSFLLFAAGSIMTKEYDSHPY